MTRAWIVVAAACSSAHAPAPAPSPSPAPAAATPAPTIDAAPTVDRQAVEACQARLAADPEPPSESLAEAARCFEQAGALGLAMQTWKRIAHDEHGRKADAEALARAAALYERIARATPDARYLVGAAEAHEDWEARFRQYGERFGRESDAADHLEKAMCLRQAASAAERAAGDKSAAFRDANDAAEHAQTLAERYHRPGTPESRCPP